jgi:ferredoxin
MSEVENAEECVECTECTDVCEVDGVDVEDVGVEQSTLPSKEFLIERASQSRAQKIESSKQRRNALLNATILACDHLTEDIKTRFVPKQMQKAASRGYFSCNGFSYSFPMKENKESPKMSYVMMIQKESGEAVFTYHMSKPDYKKTQEANRGSDVYIFTIVYLFEGGLDTKDKAPLRSNQRSNQRSTQRPSLPTLGRLGITPVKTRISEWLTTGGFEHSFKYHGFQVGNVVDIKFKSCSN